MSKSTLISTTQVLALALAVALFLPSSVLALTIQLNDRGGATFYQDQVLGDDSSEKSETEKTEVEKPETEKKESEKTETEHKEETKPENRRQEKEIKSETEKNKIEKKTREKAEVREIKRNEKRKIEIKNTDEKLKIELKSGEKTGDFEKVETMESRSVKFKQPKSATGEEMEGEFELRPDGTGEMKFKSNGVEVQAKGQFTIDPVTNQIMVTTLSGQQHELKHLPKEALDAMAKKLGAAQTASGTADTSGEMPEIELKETAEGKMVYQATIREKKKFLGMFGWDRPKTVELDDETGEVKETAASTTEVTPAQNAWFNWLRDSLSI